MTKIVSCNFMILTALGSLFRVRVVKNQAFLKLLVVVVVVSMPT